MCPAHRHTPAKCSDAIFAPLLCPAAPKLWKSICWCRGLLGSPAAALSASRKCVKKPTCRCKQSRNNQSSAPRPQMWRVGLKRPQTVLDKSWAAQQWIVSLPTAALLHGTRQQCVCRRQARRTAVVALQCTGAASLRPDIEVQVSPCLPLQHQSGRGRCQQQPLATG